MCGCSCRASLTGALPPNAPRGKASENISTGKKENRNRTEGTAASQTGGQGFDWRLCRRLIITCSLSQKRKKKKKISFNVNPSPTSTCRSLDLDWHLVRINLQQLISAQSETEGQTRGWRPGNEGRAMQRQITFNDLAALSDQDRVLNKTWKQEEQELLPLQQLVTSHDILRDSKPRWELSRRRAFLLHLLGYTSPELRTVSRPHNVHGFPGEWVGGTHAA